MLAGVDILSGHGSSFYPHPDDAVDSDDVTGDQRASSFRDYIQIEDEADVTDVVGLVQAAAETGELSGYEPAP